jgi:MraZ protein
MLIGFYIQKIDKKGRTALPSKFKHELGDKIILSRWYESSLSIFYTASWLSIVSQATGGSVITAPSPDTERFLLGGAYEIVLDAQGRFVVPLPLREYAKTEEEVVFVGLGNRVELWDKKLWEEREKHVIENAESILEENVRTSGN